MNTPLALRVFKVAHGRFHSQVTTRMFSTSSGSCRPKQCTSVGWRAVLCLTYTVHFDEVVVLVSPTTLARRWVNRLWPTPPTSNVRTHDQRVSRDVRTPSLPIKSRASPLVSPKKLSKRALGGVLRPPRQCHCIFRTDVQILQCMASQAASCSQFQTKNSISTVKTCSSKVFLRVIAFYCNAHCKIRRSGRCLCHCKVSILFSQCFETVHYRLLRQVAHRRRTRAHEGTAALQQRYTCARATLHQWKLTAARLGPTPMLSQVLCDTHHLH